MILQLRKLALIEKGATDTVVSLTSVNEGVDGSSVFGISSPANEITIEGGMVYIDSSTTELDIRILKPSSSDLTQINTWASNQTKLYVSGLLLDGTLLIGDRDTGEGTVTISINEQLTDNDVLALKITKKSVIGYAPTNGIYNGGFWIGQNLIGIYEWGDKDSDGLADSWVNAADRFVATFDDVNAEQDLADNDSGDQNRLQKQFYIPFEGTTITFSLNVDAINEYGGDYQPALSANIRDASGSILTSDTASASTTGRVSLNITVPANGVWGIVEFTSQQSVAGSQPADYSISDPMITIDGKTTYTKL